jgi:hypothetical protein
MFSDINIITRQTSFLFVLIANKNLQHTFTSDVYFHLEGTQTLPVRRYFDSNWCNVLFGTAISGYKLLNALRTAANDFSEK